jgi:microcystin-dependent protein
LAKFSILYGTQNTSVYLDNSRSSITTGGGAGQVITGEIKMWPLATAPSGYLLCDGVIHNIADYPVLGPLLGSVYGGDGTTTFGTPDMRRRVPVGASTDVPTLPVGRNDATAYASRTFAHTHTIANVNHTGTENTSTGGTGTRVNTIGGSNQGSHNHGGTGQGTFDMIPNMSLNFIIKT